MLLARIERESDAQGLANANRFREAWSTYLRAANPRYNVERIACTRSLCYAAISTPNMVDKAEFEADVATVNANAADAAAWQAKYDAANAQQRALMVNAAYNFTIGMMRNVALGQQAPSLISGLQSNPMQLTKLGSLRAAAGLLGDQVQATRSMVGPMRTLLSRGGVEVPADATASSARPVDL